MTRKLRVCVLQCANEESSGALKDVDPYRKPGVYDTAGEYEWYYAAISKSNTATQLIELGTSGKYDVFLNLCDGGWDEDRAGMDVIEALERLNLPYTGADRGFFEPSKVDIKMAVQQFGVTVPAWVHIKWFGPTGQEGVEKGLAQVLAPPEAGGLRFPLIVKHPSGYSSVGMTKQSKVANETELRQQVGLLVQQYGGALVEEFIAGREFTVLVVEEPLGPPAAQHQFTTTTNNNNNSTTAGASTSPWGSGAASNGSAATTNGVDGHLNGEAPGNANAAPATAEAEAAAGGVAVSGASAATAADDPDAATDPDAAPFHAVSYMPVECVFGPGEDFKHFQLKWHDYETCNWRPCDDPELAERLKDAARKTYLAMRGVSYGRCDFRVDAAGEVYLLEINSNCGMLYPPGQHGSGDYILTLDPHRDHMHFIRTIIHNALVRHRLRQPKVVREFVRRPRHLAPPPPPGGGGGGGGEPDAGACSGGARGSRRAAGEWGLVALVAIRAGEVVQRGEERPATLASRGWVERHWPPGSRKRTWFDEYAYPISQEVWVTRPDDPAAWALLHHSCDPNCWLRGLDLVARRDIEPGETICVDFATSRADNMEPFDCTCGAACCRRRITAADCLAPWLAERYGSHVSAYVAEKRRRAGLPL